MRKRLRENSHHLQIFRKTVAFTREILGKYPGYHSDIFDHSHCRSFHECPGIIDPIHVRLIALSNGNTPCLMVTFEMGGAPAPETFLTGLSNHTSMPIDAIFYSATHCHSAPGTTIHPKIPSTELSNSFTIR